MLFYFTYKEKELMLHRTFVVLFNLIYKLLKSLFSLILNIFKFIFYIPVWFFSKIMYLLGYDSKSIDRILEDIDEMSGRQFEEFTASKLKKNGFYNISLTPKTSDYGVDIIALYDDEIFAIQCKKYSSKVGNYSVQEAYTGKNYYKSTKAAVITNNYFTNNAIKLAEENEVYLWNREDLIALIQGKLKVK